jgi:hypothetical protein
LDASAKGPVFDADDVSFYPSSLLLNTKSVFEYDEVLRITLETMTSSEGKVFVDVPAPMRGSNQTYLIEACVGFEMTPYEVN